MRLEFALALRTAKAIGDVFLGELAHRFLRPHLLSIKCKNPLKEDCENTSYQKRFVGSCESSVHFSACQWPFIHFIWSSSKNVCLILGFVPWATQLQPQKQHLKTRTRMHMLHRDQSTNAHTHTCAHTLVQLRHWIVWYRCKYEPSPWITQSM